MRGFFFKNKNEVAISQSANFLSKFYMGKAGDKNVLTPHLCF